MINKKICLKDIAEKVGVSTALVSYVLNNKKEGRIKKSVAERIREVAAELNYRTNQIAKSLKTNRTFTIGLIVVDISNPFSSGLARIIEDEAEKNDYTLLFGSSDENVIRSNKLIDAFLNRQVDGLIIAPGEKSAPQIKFLQEQNVPFVLIDRYFPEINTNYVGLDNYKASYSAVQHLINCRNKRIGLITVDTGLHNIRERKRGYVEALEKNGLAFDKQYAHEVSMEKLEEGVEKAIDEMLANESPIDALLFTTNAIATCGLKHIKKLRIKVPEQLSLVSFDKTDALDLFYAPLTYINQPLPEMGRIAMRTLIDIIEGKETHVNIHLPGTLVIRSSTLGHRKYALE